MKMREVIDAQIDAGRSKVVIQIKKDEINEKKLARTLKKKGFVLGKVKKISPVS